MTEDSRRYSEATTPRARSPVVEPRELTFQTGIPTPVPASPLYPKTPKPIKDPLTWSNSRKAFTTFFCCTLSVLAGYATGSSNATLAIQGDLWGVSETVMLLGTTTYALAFALGPMFLASFSEVRGRKPVFLASGFLLAICSMCCGLADSLGGFLVARFFTGMFSSTFSTMVGGVITDMYRNEDRNTPMAVFAAACFFGTGLGSLVSDIIVYHLYWRWDYYILAIAVALLSLLSIVLVSETRQNVLLSLQAEKLNKWQRACEKLGMQGVYIQEDDSYTNSDAEASDIEKVAFERSQSTSNKCIRNVQWYVGGEEERPALLHSIRISLVRPMHLLVTEPIVFWFSMWIAFAWGVLYLALAGIAITFDAAYPFNQQQTGAIYTAIPVSAVLGACMHIAQDKLFAAKGPAAATEKKKKHEPESRLRFATWESLFFPIGLFWWAWTCRPEVPWIVPTLGVGCAFMGTYTIFLAVLNYTADSYHRLASSALAAQSLTRNVIGALFPLASTPMFRAMTTAGALSFLGGVALLLSAVPFVLLVYGPKIRARSKIASEIMSKEI